MNFHSHDVSCSVPVGVESSDGLVGCRCLNDTVRVGVCSFRLQNLSLDNFLPITPCTTVQSKAAHRKACRAAVLSLWGGHRMEEAFAFLLTFVCLNTLLHE